MASTARAAGAVVLALVVVVALGVVAFRALSGRGSTAPVPGEERCVATAGDRSVAIDLDQAHYAAIIVGVSVRRGLPPRAASIALATVYQETGIRNLSYGDRDSVGLFQQRPSQGWGNARQLRDPYYATGTFYDALVKIKGWATGDINDVAQRVQRSGHPEAYRDHEADARVLASTLAGYSPGGFRCLDRSGTPGDARALTRALRRSFGSVRSQTVDNRVLVTARTTRLAWAYAHSAVADAKAYGVTAVRVGGQVWQTGEYALPEWTATTPAVGARRVEITLR